MDNNLKKKVRSLCRLEYIGAGFYMHLSGAYKKNRKLAKVFKTFAEHEEAHGVMFGHYYAENFGPSPNSTPWKRVGKMMAFCQCCFPLKWKLKMLEGAETKGVLSIEQVLASGERNTLIEILEKILPQEKAHAGLYRKLYG